MVGAVEAWRRLCGEESLGAARAGSQTAKDESARLEKRKGTHA